MYKNNEHASLQFTCLGWSNWLPAFLQLIKKNNLKIEDDKNCVSLNKCIISLVYDKIWEKH